MGIEIERKYLVASDAWRGDVDAQEEIWQGYLDTREATVRIRIKGERAFLTIKGPTVGISRTEFEYGIPVEDAQEMLETLCGDRTLRKTRHEVYVGDHLWVVDEFLGRHAGLVLAELELPSEDTSFELPEWVGEDVSQDPSYYNSNLVRGQTVRSAQSPDDSGSPR